MEKITTLTSTDLVANNIETLKNLFPTIVKEGKIDLKELQSLLGENVEETDEFYRFTWAGKNQARIEANKPSTATLRPNQADSKNWDTTQNVFIEVDNLEVLKLLQKSYANKIKMIYIDPPYNTGKDFVYKDNYKDNLGNYLTLTGQTDDEGKKLSTNTETDGRYHSNWLNMMYPRLRLARNLMKDDGVIFMSIDDNEVHNLRRLCDEIFGEENFVTNIIWHKKYGAANDAKYFSDVHDHILVYCKNINKWRPNMFERPEELNLKYKNSDDDPRGEWIATNLSVKTYSKSNDYIIKGPTGIDFNPPPSRAWVVSWDKYNELLNDGRITFGKDNTSRPYLKTYLSEVQDGIVPTTIWSYNDAGHNIGAKSEIRDLFSDSTVPFDTPKPTKLLKRIISVGENKAKDDFILDFFSGSGTTAHAVMQLNSEDGGSRKCISVQLPEPTDEKSEAFKANYKTIAEITKERIRRAGKLIYDNQKQKIYELKQKNSLLQEDKDQIINLQTALENLDIGFKAFKLDSSNIVAWDGNPDNLEASLDLFENNIKPNRSEVDILFEILLKYGLDLTVTIEEKTISNKKVYSIGAGTIFICLANDITPAVSEGIGAWKEILNPTRSRVIFKDTGFENDKNKTNAMQILKRFGIEEVNSI